MNLGIETHLKELHRQVSTPALIIYQPQMETNLLHMQQLAETNRVRLRPHTKTHKSPFLAQRQIKLGAKGITVAKLSEAEVMLTHGLNDIFIANQITQPLKMKRLRALHDRCNLIIGIDDPRQIDLLKNEFETVHSPLQVRIEIDSGLHRCGVQINKALTDLAKKIADTFWLKLEGIFTHAGQVYAARSRSEVEAIGHAEGHIMEQAVNLLQSAGISVETVSVGSTPTVAYSAAHPVVNEIRPGNYIFYDAMQLALGSAQKEECSLFVLTTIVSQPAPDRIVIDTGSKALSTDGAFWLNGFGLPLDIPAVIERVSEEHGILKLNESFRVRPGEPLLIIPNHACVTANLFSQYHLFNPQKGIQAIPVLARGKSQ